jgi:hypothetical protein
MMRALAIVALAAACGKESKSSSSSSEGAGAAASSGGAASSSDGACKSVKLCDEFPAAKIDAMCGTKIVKASPTSVADATITADQCSYYNSNGNNLVTIVRECLGSRFDDAQVKQMFETGHAAPGSDQDRTEVPGLGDQAYYLVGKNHRYATLAARKGRIAIVVQDSALTQDTEATHKTGCMTALYNEIAAK